MALENILCYSNENQFTENCACSLHSFHCKNSIRYNSIKIAKLGTEVLSLIHFMDGLMTELYCSFEIFLNCHNLLIQKLRYIWFWNPHEHLYVNGIALINVLFQLLS